MSDVLIVGDSFRNPEIRHEVPVGVPDPFLYVEHGDRRLAVVGSFEVDRVKEADGGLEVHAFERFGRDELQAQGLNYHEILREVSVRVCAELGVESVLVSENELREAFRFMYGRAKLACEVAGAAPTAALLSRAVDLASATNVVAVVSGGNVAAEMAVAILASDEG